MGGAAIGGDGVWRSIEEGEREAEVGVEDGVLRLEMKGLLNLFEASGGIALLGGDEAEEVEEIGVIGLGLEELAVLVGGLIESTGPMMGDGGVERRVGWSSGHPISLGIFRRK